MRTQKRTRFLSALMALLMVFSLLPASALAADSEQTLADHVVINQAYGGGGNSGAVYTHDFIELYNPTDEDVNLNGWTVQYASKTGTFKVSSGSATELTGTIKAHGFYLIQEAAGLNVHKLLEGHVGGEQQMSAMIEQNQMDLVLFFRDPELTVSTHSDSADLSKVIRMCDIHNVPLATNIASAEILLKSLEKGDLDWREMYH